jgi:hydrogenase expression/formation protein HypC
MCLAVPGEIISIEGTGPLELTAAVRFGGITKQVSLACVPEAKVGQYVLVHVGLAITVIDEAEARRVFEYLEQIDELAELSVESS